MEAVEHEFITIPQFIEIAQRYSNELGWIFRGQDNISWPLRPKGGRPEYYLEANELWKERGQSSSDLGRFKTWREQAIAFCDSLPENDFECLAFAQHYGLVTRLLDWTTNPLVALFFAVELHGEVDGAVFCHFPWWSADREKSSIEKVFDRVVRFSPRPFDRRIVAQGAVFTFHSVPDQPLVAQKPTEEAAIAVPDGVDLVVIRVVAKIKSIIQRQLSELGISRKTLFPDLEGLSDFVNWKTAGTASWRAQKEESRAKNSS